MAFKHIATVLTITLASGFAFSAQAGVKSTPSAADRTESSYFVDKPDTPPLIKPSGKTDGQRAESTRSSTGATKSPK